MSALALPASSFWLPFQGLEIANAAKHGTFAMRDFDRLKCIQAVIDGELKPIRAAERLGLATRQVRRLARRYAAAGPVGLISKRFSRPSNNRLHDAIADQVIKLLRSTYADFGPTLAAEKLRTKHGIDLAKETVRQLQIAVGLWSHSFLLNAQSNRPFSTESLTCAASVVESSFFDNAKRVAQHASRSIPSSPERISQLAKSCRKTIW